MEETMIRLITVFVPMLLSLTVHECAHAGSAYLLGDDTAKREGRLTLNPLPHIDIIGTVILPLICVFTGSGFFFGWAKPVPVNPRYFDRKWTMRKGMLLTAAAGPASNLLLALLCAGGVALMYHTGNFEGLAFKLLLTTFQINIVLAAFNLIPVYPLDGQKVLSGLLSYRSSAKFESFSASYGTWLLLAVFVFGGDIISPVVMLCFHFILGTIFGLPV